MARKVGQRLHEKDKAKLCPDCKKELKYIMLMPKKRMFLKCECGKYFNKSLKSVEIGSVK